MTKAEKLKKILDLERYHTNDFWSVCPYQPNDMLIDNRRKEPMNTWRKIGMCWYVLSGYTSFDSGEFFDRDHASVLNALDKTRALIEISDPLIMEIIQLIKKQIGRQHKSQPFDKQPVSAVNLETQLLVSKPHLFDPSQFYCSLHAIDRNLGLNPGRCKNQCNACKNYE